MSVVDRLEPCQFNFRALNRVHLLKLNYKFQMELSRRGDSVRCGFHIALMTQVIASCGQRPHVTVVCKREKLFLGAPIW